ncbi:hybrid sensor histidine kinase/response regulator [Geotalea toluenoxydans]
MKPPLRILIIDDSPEDAVLLVRELKKEFSPVMERVETEEAMLSAIEKGKWDVVVSDFVMPEFNGLAAISILHQQNRDLPFIMVSGQMGEELAVEAMRAGAHDYLVKGNLSRLIPAIKRELKEASDRDKRHKAEAALHATEARFKSLVEQSLVGIYLLQDGIFSYVNPKFAEIFNFQQSELVDGRALLDLVIDEDRQAVAEICETILGYSDNGPPCYFRGQGKCGKDLQLEMHGTKTELNGRPAIIGTLLDITERKKAFEQLRQAQKMEALGQLAGGIAHDFNNLLTIINGYSTLLLRSLDRESPQHQEAEQILKAGDRAADLTRQLLTFSRRQILAPRMLNLNDQICGIEKMLHRVVGEHIYLETSLAGDIGLIKIDPGQVEQIVMNLVVNAGDAMKDGGVISIATTNAEIDQSFASIHPGSVMGGYVMLAVTDNGTGMTEEVKSRLFEPFFTTKEMGRGTGLGLATVYGIVKQNGGYIDVASELEKGTTFRIYLPRLKQQNTPVKLVSEVPAEGSHTILVVEDEPGVLNLVTHTLKNKGFNIIGTTDPLEALEIFDQRGNEIDLLLSDVVMPFMNGPKLAEALTRKKPALKVIFMSGHTDDKVNFEKILENGTPFIAKPFTNGALVTKIARTLANLEDRTTELGADR